MDVGLDVFSQIPKLIRELVEIIQKPFDERRRRRNEFFEQEIMTIHETMELINEDYTSSFSELLDLFKSETDLPRIIQLLKKKRLVLLRKRIDVRAYSNELTNIKKRGYIKEREIAAFLEFAEAIHAYLKDASPVDVRFTWYSAFIDEFEAMTRRGESPFKVREFGSISADRIVDKVRAAFSSAVQTDMPKAWERYSGSFYQLKLELTR